MPYGSKAGHKEGQFDLDKLFRVSGLCRDEFPWGLAILSGILSGDTNCSYTQLAVIKGGDSVWCHDEDGRVKMHVGKYEE